MNFTKIARQEAASFWKGSFEHPFITALADGNLAPEIFRYYLLQDRYYLEHFSKLYHLIAEQTNDREVQEQLQENAENLKLGEMAIRRSSFQN